MKKNKTQHRKGNTQNKAITWFCIISAIIFIACFCLLRFTENLGIHNYNDYVSVPDLILTFIGVASAAFFSLATFLNLNFSRENKTERKIIANYSLLNFCKEITVLKEKTVEDKPHTTICFLVTEKLNSPIFKVLFKKIESSNTIILKSENGEDGKYGENILDRGYNCIEVDIPLNIKETKELFKSNSLITIELDIISVFKVTSNVDYQLVISKKKTGKNPDKKEYPKLTTFLLHHSTYKLENQSIYEEK
jgi:hypothetical protein